MEFTYEELAKTIDHSLLNPTLTEEQLEDGMNLAVSYGVASVCILPYYMMHCSTRLSGSGVLPSTTVGFPHGGHATATKVREAELAIGEGCKELDMVVNISQVLSDSWEVVKVEIMTIVRIAHAADCKVKVIFENCYLNDEQKIRLCEICNEFDVDWIKTSTGYGTGGATMDDLRLMTKHAADHVQVKAAGGVRDLDALIEVKKLGVTRCGASRTSEILDEARRRLGLPAIEVKVIDDPLGGY